MKKIDLEKIKYLLKLEDKKGILYHFFLVSLMLILFLFFLFYIYFPYHTNQNESITVPDVLGLKYEELDAFLTERKLKFKISKDSGYVPNQPPLSVIAQFPKPNSKVKENRKIYLTLNVKNPPNVKMPNLIDGSLKNAQLVLKAYDLVLGKTIYMPDLFFNTVLSQKYNNNNIEPGRLIPKGSVIDIVLGDGLGKTNLETPNLIGLDIESAEFVIIGSGLTLGNIEYIYESEQLIDFINDSTYDINKKSKAYIGKVIAQKPLHKQYINIKDKVNLWIFNPKENNE